MSAIYDQTSRHSQGWDRTRIVRMKVAPSALPAEIAERKSDQYVDGLGIDLMPAPTPDDLVSRLDIANLIEGRIALRNRILNPAGAFYHSDTAALVELQVILEFVEGMEGKE